MGTPLEKYKEIVEKAISSAKNINDPEERKTIFEQIRQVCEGDAELLKIGAAFRLRIINSSFKHHSKIVDRG